MQPLQNPLIFLLVVQLDLEQCHKDVPDGPEDAGANPHVWDAWIIIFGGQDTKNCACLAFRS
jgi:hypothetical protein